jgi:hypothetical protein
MRKHNFFNRGTFSGTFGRPSDGEAMAMHVRRIRELVPLTAAILIVSTVNTHQIMLTCN